MRLRGLDALRSRNYVLYLVGHFTSQTGAWVEQTAVSWILYELTGSALLLGLAGLARAAPTIALALVGGAVADRLPRRAMLYCTEAAMLATSLAIGFLASLAAMRLPHADAHRYAAPETLWQGMQEGLQFVWDHGPLRVALALE